MDARGIISNGVYTNSVYSEYAGKITEICVAEGENINKGSLKNYKDFEALFYLQSIKLACHTFRAEDIKLLG